MKKTIFLLFIFVIIYIGIMFFIQDHYGYDWTPANSEQNKITDVLTKEDSPFPITNTTQKPSVEEENNLTNQEESAVVTINEEESLPNQNLIQEETINQETFIEEQTVLEEKRTEEPEQQKNGTVESFSNTDKTADTLTKNTVQEQSVKQETIQNIAPVQSTEKKAPILQEQLEAADLVDIETLHAKVFLDIRYATVNNFTGKKLYKKAKCYLKRPAANALVKAAKMALQADESFNLCIYDCYRPDSVQKIMLKSTTQKGFLSKISNHSRGMAVDLGPCDSAGEPLLTPTTFDTFSKLSASNYQGDEIPQIAIRNRENLQEIMKKAGFSTISNEWWHFDYKGAKNEEVLNIKF